MPDPSSPATAPGEPFASADEAWFWCVLSTTARHDGARLRAGLAEVPRPCEPLDILHSDALAGELDLLVDYGRRLAPPDPTWREEAHAARLWDEAIDRLTPVLRRKGILA